MSRLHHGPIQPHARYVPPQRVLAVLSGQNGSDKTGTDHVF